MKKYYYYLKLLTMCFKLTFWVFPLLCFLLFSLVCAQECEFVLIVFLAVYTKSWCEIDRICFYSPCLIVFTDMMMCFCSWSLFRARTIDVEVIHFLMKFFWLLKHKKWWKKINRIYSICNCSHLSLISFISI